MFAAKINGCLGESWCPWRQRLRYYVLPSNSLRAVDVGWVTLARARVVCLLTQGSAYDGDDDSERLS